ncbi:helix-turn-helix transcriptional regulator [Micromonospora sp. NPDC000442]|uniref:helix-turn-helix transcriptional regulator n=1 Tax=Micromonospora sp. NPDC000442 TaxID=3364217 RepID=UPI0036AD0C12
MGEVPGPLVGPGEIQQMLGVGRSRFRQLAMYPTFPKPFQVLMAGAVWLRSDIEAWIAQYRQPRPPADEDEQG